jgi:hypothetical protein
MNTNTFNQSQDLPQSSFDNFCHMIMEDFLMRKNMGNTLTEFRKEWVRPSDEETMMSWYDVASKLRLPELMSQGKNDNSPVIENVVYALIRESSIRSRRTSDVILNGLTTLPKSSSLPSIVVEPPIEDLKESKFITTLSTKTRPKSSDINKAKKSITRRNSTPIKDDRETTQIIKKNVAIMMAAKNQHQQQSGFIKPTSENWVPELTRFKSIQRDFAVAKVTLNDIIMREAGNEREMKGLRTSDLQKAQNLESLGKTKKTPCGCCQQKFLYCNLPLKVSQKVIRFYFYIYK